MLNINYIHCLERRSKNNILTYWGHPLSSFRIGMGKALMGPGSKKEVETAGQSWPGTEQLLEERRITV